MWEGIMERRFIFPFMLAVALSASLAVFIYTRISPTPNPALEYARELLPPGEAEVFAPLGRDGVLEEVERVLIEEYSKLPGDLRESELVERVLSGILGDCRVTYGEVARLQDLDRDGIPNLTLELAEDSELARALVEQGAFHYKADGVLHFPGELDSEYADILEPTKPNPVAFYCLERGIGYELMRILVPSLEADGRCDPTDRELIDLLSRLPPEERGSEEVMSCLQAIVAKKQVSREDLSLLDDKFVNPTLPKIVGLEWEPTRIVLDKVYEGKVSFTARDGKTPIAYAELRWIPVEYHYMIYEYGMRPEDYHRVFPREGERVVVLEPLDGRFDELQEEFEVDIEEIVGGREYEIVVLVRDAAGNVWSESIKTPYIRELPNLGRLLYEGGKLTLEELEILGRTPGYEEFGELAKQGESLEFEGRLVIAATYYPLYPDPHPWEDLEPMAVHPIMGKYDVRDPVVIAKHIDWATGHGINCFFFSWGIDDENANRKAHSNILKFINSSLASQIHFAILYEISRFGFFGIEADEYGMIKLEDPDKWKNIINDFKLLQRDFLVKKNYLFIKGKPVVYIYNGDALTGNLKEFIQDLDENLENPVLLISDHAHPSIQTLSLIHI